MRTKRLIIARAIFAAALVTLPAARLPADTVISVAGPFVEHISPPALQRGRTNRLELFGRELDGALELWTSVPGAQLKSTLRGKNDSQHVSLDVDVPADAPLGLYGLRLATRSGLSNVHLFLIDELPIQLRKPSASASSTIQRMKVSLPAAIYNNCRKATVDRYEIEVKSSQRITFEVIGNRFGKDYDPLVTIRDAHGRIVAERDNDVGLFFDCRFQHTFKDAGVYYVDVRDARFAGGPTWHYVLRMGDFPVARVSVPSSATPGKTSRLQLPQIPGTSVDIATPANAPAGWSFQEVRLAPQKLATWLPLHVDRHENQLEAEPNGDRDAASPVTLPATLHGVLAKTGDHDWFKFEMKQGKTMTFRSDARGFGSPADLELVLFDQDGKEVRRSDDVNVSDGQNRWSVDAKFEYYAQKDGPHFLHIRDMSGEGGPAFAYRVEVTRNDPTLELKSAVSRITLPQGNFQPIPLKVTRRHFGGPIELKLVGAPSGVVLEPATIPADVSEIVCRLKAAGSTPQGLATIQIVGHWASDDPKNRPSATSAATTFPLIDRRVKDKDLRTLALRDDQLHPPPSLTNRLALLITPPAPFDVQLPEADVLITKYVDGKFPIVTTRTGGFDSPISFTVAGGQIGDEGEERSNIFVRLPNATAAELKVSGLVFNRIRTNNGKFRVDFTATTRVDSRRVTLKRIFEMEVKSAFSPAAESASVEILPGGTAKFRILANRTPAFDGDLTLTASPLKGFTHVETIEIPTGQKHVDIEVRANPETTPGNYQLRSVARGNVGKYEEQVQTPNLSITIKKPPVEKKP